MTQERARVIKIHDRDNVAIVANAGGLPAGESLPDGTVLLEAVPAAHKVALADLPAGAPVIRYGQEIGNAARPIPR